MENRTTELLKGCGKVIDNLICGETFCDRNISEKKWLCPVCKSELRGRLDVLKELSSSKERHLKDYKGWDRADFEQQLNQPKGVKEC